MSERFQKVTKKVKIMEEYAVDRVPTVLLLDDGEVFARATGFQPEEIFEILFDWRRNHVNFICDHISCRDL